MSGAAGQRGAYRALIVASAMLLAYASARVGIGIAAGTANPARSLAWAPGNALALRRRAEDRLQIDRSAAGRAAAARDARAALSRQLLEPAALRTLGLAAALGNDAPGAATLLALAQRMSRRDAKTQIWFAGEAIAARSSDAALRHYDIALRTSPDARPLLYPILCDALADDRQGAAVARLLAAAPNWTTEFVDACSDRAPTHRALAELLTRAPLVLAASSPSARAKLVAALAREHDYAPAAALFGALARGRPRDRAPDRGLPPFDWSVTSAADLLAERIARDGLYLLAAPDRGGVVATRLLVLGPGTHRLRVHASNASLARGLQWAITCDGRAGPPLALLAPLGGDFAVPAGCGAVWLTLRARAGWPIRREGALSPIAVDEATA